MTSFKSKATNFMIRNNHLFRGQLHKEVFTMNTSIQMFRDRCEKGAARFGKIPQGITVQPLKIEEIHAEWLVPAGSADDKIIMYVHGGGYVSGSCSDHRAIISKLAHFTGIKTLLYEYRLAPEFTFPAAVDDSLTVYRWLLASGYEPKNILIAGESAGGGLCLATLLAIKEQQLPYPAATVAISPWTDLTCSSESYHTKGKLSPAPTDSWIVFGNHYAGNHSKDLPLISPLFGDLQGLPPILIISGVDDELYEDGEKFYLKAKAAGVDVTFIKGEHQVHCYPLLAPMFPEATEAMNKMVVFIQQHLKI